MKPWARPGLDVPRTVVVTACDANHFPLAEELLASLQAIENRHFDIGFIQVGEVSAPASIMDMADLSAVIPTGDLIGPKEGFQLAYLAIKTRLPEFFPGYEIYVWLDSDTWVQNAAGIDQIIECAQLADVCLHPQTDVNYFGCQFPDNYTLHAYQVIFGKEDRLRFSRHPMINAGVFGAAAQSPLWRAWEMLLTDVRQRLQFQKDRFFSDQIPLHKLIYSNGISFYPLRAVNNWLVLHSLPRLDPATGQLTAPSLPFEQINIVHLVGPSKWEKYKLNDQVTSLRYFAIHKALRGCDEN
jgi:hypothetical protein